MSTSGRDDRPMANTYWVVPGRFAAGEYPGAWDRGEAAARVRTLLQAGIDCFIDLTQRDEGLEPYAEIAAQETGRLGTEFVHARHAIVDMSVPRSRQQTARILDAIDEALDAGRNVYVHCWGGIGRTGTVVGCWFVRHGMTGDEALAGDRGTVAGNGEEVPPTPLAADRTPACLRPLTGPNRPGEVPREWSC